MSNTHHFFNRQPILSYDGEVFAYDLQYEGIDDEVRLSVLSSHLISSVLNNFGKKRILGNKLGFIKIDEAFLLSDRMLTAPVEGFIYSLMDNLRVTKELYARLQEMKQLGYIFALHDMSIKTGSFKRFVPILTLIDYVKVNMKGFPQEYLISLRKLLNEYKIMLIGVNIQEHELCAIARGLKFDYVEGYYFSEPVLIEDKNFDAKSLTLLQLYNMLLSDASVEKLVLTFENNPELIVQLLQFINSQSFALVHNVSSISQVLTLLGREQLAQWLMMLMYGNSINQGQYNEPLMQMVQNRTRLMQGLFKLIHPRLTKKEEGKAFFVGVMSLSSTVMLMPLRIILKEMNLSLDVQMALLERSGELGEMLVAVESIEKFKLKKLKKFMMKYGIKAHNIEYLMKQTSVEILNG